MKRKNRLSRLRLRLVLHQKDTKKSLMTLVDRWLKAKQFEETRSLNLNATSSNEKSLRLMGFHFLIVDQKCFLIQLWMNFGYVGNNTAVKIVEKNWLLRRLGQLVGKSVSCDLNGILWNYYLTQGTLLLVYWKS